jgi:hypothetical protein
LGWVVLWVGILGGCAASGSRKPGADGGTNAVDVIRPMDGSVGRIVRVQAPLKFVVVDYRLNQPPAPEQRLVVLRDGERVAELKAGYIRRETTVSADILSGEPRDGDEVRIDEGAAPVAR